MMRFTLAAVVVLLAAGSATPASTQRHNNTPPRCQGHAHPVTEHRKLAKRVFRLSHWQSPAPGPGAKKTMRRLRSCAVPRKRDEMRGTWRSEKRQLYRHAEFREITPYPGGGTYWAVPWYIVSCESGGSWSAYNSSGAAGPYQIMPEHGRPFPVNGWAEQMVHHQIAADLYAGGSGAGNWVCA